MSLDTPAVFSQDHPLALPKTLKTPFLVMLLLSSIMALTVLAQYFRVQPVIPLFYTLAEPQAYVVKKIWLILFPVAGFTLTGVHYWLIRLLMRYEHTIQYVFAWVSVILVCLFCLALWRIIWIIT